MSIRIKTGARVHMGLIDLGRCTDRAYGGIGFAVSMPNTIVLAESSDQFQIIEAVELSACHRMTTKHLISKIESLYSANPTKFTIEQTIENHVGLGSTTTLALALIESFDRLHKLQIPVTEKQILCGRGGASGIGVNSFFYGGVVRDNGHSWAGINQIKPSAFRIPSEIPSVAQHCAFPQNWDVIIANPPGKKISGSEEAAFFSENTPINCDEVLKTKAAIDEYIFPGFAKEDLSLLSKGAKIVGRTGFKRREIANQTPTVSTLLEEGLLLKDVAAGMSSFGPTIYFILKKDDDNAHSAIQHLCERHDVPLLVCPPQTQIGFVAYEQ